MEYDQPTCSRGECWPLLGAEKLPTGLTASPLAVSCMHLHHLASTRSCDGGLSTNQLHPLNNYYSPHIISNTCVLVSNNRTIVVCWDLHYGTCMSGPIHWSLFGAILWYGLYQRMLTERASVWCILVYLIYLSYNRNEIIIHLFIMCIFCFNNHEPKLQKIFTCQ